MEEGWGKRVGEDGRIEIGQYIKYGCSSYGNMYIEYPNGDRYLGMIEDSKRQGKGEELRKDGSKFKGIFNNGIINGRGQMITKEGKVINGVYSYGVLNEDLTDKKIGLKDSIVVGLESQTRWILTKLQSYKYF